MTDRIQTARSVPSHKPCLTAVLRFVHDRRARIVLGVAVLAALVLVWAELAVGLF